MKKLVIILLVSLISISITTEHAHGTEKSQLVITIKSSPEAVFKTNMLIRSDEMIQMITHSESRQIADFLPLTDMYVILKSGTRKKSYIVTRHGALINLQNRQQLLLPQYTEKQLLAYANALREKHYGQLVSWEKMKKVLPKNAEFEVIDIETGQHFEVQRRAGDLHADVQPLTREDTKTMKNIYEGKWSWKRRAILVKSDGKFIAASMHGMPHGAGAIQNGFPGHFCIHFYQSSTHRSENVDPTHELMVFKSAGKLQDYLEEASPYEMIDAFLVALNQQDSHLLQMTLTREYDADTKERIHAMDEIEAIRIASPYEKDKVTDQLAIQVPVDVSLYRRGTGDEHRTIKFILRRNSPNERWRIDVDSLKDLSNEME